MKWIILLLSMLVAVEGGMLMYCFQSGHPPFTEVEAPQIHEESQGKPTPPASSLLVHQEDGMIAELATALQASREEVREARQQLDKREDNLQELNASYLKVRQVVEGLLKDLETQLIRVDENQDKNFKTLAEVYAKMNPLSSARSLQHMDPERAALILSLMDSRAMAAVMDSAVSSSADGGESVAQWSDAIRRLNDVNGEVGL